VTLGRPLKPLDPDAGPVARFASKLRAAREAMPKQPPSYRELGERVHRSKSSFSVACSGTELPTWDVTADFLKACGREVDTGWWTDWTSARAEAESLGLKVPALPVQLPFAEARTDSTERSMACERASVLERQNGGESSLTSEKGPTNVAAAPRAARLPSGQTAHAACDLGDKPTAPSGAAKSAWGWMTTTPGVVITLAAVGVLVMGILVWTRPDSTPGGSSPTCEDVGVAHETVDAYRVNRQAWLNAYNAAGGRDKLGCPVQVREQGLVHEWGRGLSQDLADEQNRQTRLMALDVDKVIVMTGTYWTDYTKPHNQFAAGLQGYPTSDPITCGNARVVPLEGGEFTPGAMVSTPAGRFVWLPRPVWLRYLELGGPQGILGRPLNPLDENIEGVIQFENGTAIQMRDRQATVNHDSAKTVPATTSTVSCPP
jgi:hypothetical protein